MSQRFTISHIPRRFLKAVVRGYQLVISPYFPTSCRYSPSCSQYAIQAIEKYGAAKGAVLTSHRIMRCHPWGGHGYDPPVWYGERVGASDDANGEAASESR